MKKIYTILTIPILMCISFESEAQLGNRLKQAASRGLGNALEKRVEKEAEKIAQRQLEKAFENIYGPDMPSGGGFNIGKILEGIDANVEIADTYDFSSYSVMEINSLDEKGKASEPFQMKTYFSPDGKTAAMEIENKDQKNNSGKTVIISDLERNASIILIESEGKKSSIAYGYDFDALEQAAALENWEEWEEEMEESDFSIKKTGNTKTIHGYKCDEYVSESEEGTATFWITKEPIDGGGSFWTDTNPMLGTSAYQRGKTAWGDVPMGNMMEMLFESKTDKSRSELKITDMNKNSSTSFVMSDYPNMLKTEK
ncbi:DUF4412 domain-containing protein [Belliella sp. R4-6]|uniref:DUF4412 domain-containing protein n=1 Tax=Belliella alkalica TaxID=1730871 RepID=A0ABS9VE29_9BACT|nr:DUF4412 domain-containing protein [Belliella alkalica]MCH7414704.1 DUF4412 domain-containing protein [Belliella alkalica]